MKRQIGDKVRIRKDLIVDEMYGKVVLSEEMDCFKGLEATINRVYPFCYDLDIDDDEFCWTDEMLEDIEEETTDCQSPNDILESLARKITPQSLESNDGRFSVKVSDAEFLELTMTMLKASEDGYMQDDIDNVQKLEFHVNDLDRLIEILQAAKKIETRCWDTIIEQFK